MITLIKNAQVFSPNVIGKRDVLLAGHRIAAVEPCIDLHGTDINIIEARDTWLLPGFVDPLTHPCGGGGEGGFDNRTHELEAVDFIEAGVTTPVGALGTDSITRSLDVLYGQVMKLRENGLAARMYSGSYRVPAGSLTGDVARDMLLVEPVIGVGEVAIADHRSSYPSQQEFRRLASDVHLGGILSGKGGTLFIHVGDGRSALSIIEETLLNSELPRRLFFPTHCNRNTDLLEHAIKHAKRGGFIDFTVSTTPELIDAGDIPALDALKYAIESGAPIDRLSLSSDSGGSLPHYVDGQLVGLQVARPTVLLETLKTVASRDTQEVPRVIAALTRNPADALHLTRKGRVEPGADADLLLFDPREKNLSDVFCLGEHLLRKGQVITIHTD